MKNKTILILILIMSLSSACKSNSTEGFSSSNNSTSKQSLATRNLNSSYGKSTKNSFVGECDDILYYIYQENLYKKEKERELSTKVELYDNFKSHSIIRINGDLILISTKFTEKRQKVKFYNLSKSQEFDEFEIEEKIQDIRFYNNTIYFTSYDDNTFKSYFYFKKINFEPIKILNNKDKITFEVSFNKVFYSMHNGGVNEIYSCDLDGNNKNILIKDRAYLATGFYENTAIIYDDKKTIFYNFEQNTKKEVEIRFCVWDFLQRDDFLIMSDFDNSGIYKVKVNGTYEKIVSKVCGDIDLINQTIYMYPIEEHLGSEKNVIEDGIYKIDLDGSNFEKLT